MTQRSFAMVRVLIVALAMPALGCSGEIDNIPTTPDPVISTETFTGTLNINGGQTHQFFTLATGSVTATLTSLGDEPPAKVGFSMGTMAGATCSVVLRNDAAVVTSVLVGTVTTLQGALCVSVYDVGGLSKPVDYTFTVSHP